MQAFTTAIDMPVGDPSVTSCFLLDQGFSEASVRRARIAWTSLTESITNRELLSRVFGTNSPNCRLTYVVRLVLAENPLREVEMETPIQRTGHAEEGGTDEILRPCRQDCQIFGVLGSLGVHLPVEDANLKIV